MIGLFPGIIRLELDPEFGNVFATQGVVCRSISVPRRLSYDPKRRHHDSFWLFIFRILLGFSPISYLRVEVVDI